MEIAVTILGGLIVTIVGGIAVVYYQKYLERRAAEKAKKREEEVRRREAALLVGSTVSAIDSLLSSEEIQLYKQQIISGLKGDWFDEFINLHMIPIKLRSETGSPEIQQYTIFEAAERFEDTPIAIVGEPGAGKTTLVQRLAIHYAENGPRIPLFVNMGTYSRQNNLLDVFNITISESSLATLVSAGKILFIFDGLNEVSRDHQDYAIRALASFIQRYANNQFFVTCRTGEFPAFLRDKLRRLEVQRIALGEISECLTRVLGPETGQNVYNSLPFRIIDLCRNPLMLNMLTYIYERGNKPTEVPQSKATLYEQFLIRLYSREEERRATIEVPRIIREDFLSHLATKMNIAQQTFAKKSEAERWLQELYGAHYTGSGLNLLTVFREVLNLVPIKAEIVKPGQSEDINIKFMHQSFQEYYAARHLYHRFTDQPDETLIEITKYATPENESWWETLSLLVGLVDDATLIIRAIKQQAQIVAEKQRDQRVFTLAARCIHEATHIDPREVDDTIIRILTAFKFGWVAFDYNLIYGLKIIRPDQRSADFPVRLIDDVDWFNEKYVRASPAKLDSNLDLEKLLQYIDSDDENLIIDALFTLRDLKDRGEAVQPLIQKLQSTSGVVREQVIITLGYLGAAASEAVPFLIDIINNPDETKWARLYALGAFSRIGDSRAAPAIIDYLLNHSNPYRDSASWTLQGIQKANQTDLALLNQLKEVYIRALLSETDDIEGKYAKGNIVYSLGELNATEYNNDIIAWLNGEVEPYVIEDGIQALGRLRSPDSLPIVIEHLSHPDPVVRVMAIDAIVALLPTYEQNTDLLSSVLNTLQDLLDDGVIIVKEHAELALKSIGLSPQQLVESGKASTEVEPGSLLVKSPPHPDTVDLAIVTAMPEELEPVLGLIGGREHWQPFLLDKFVHHYSRFEFNSLSLTVVACSLWKYGGNPTTAQILRLKPLHPRLIAMSGICAGWESKGIHYGDVIIADRAFHAGEGKQTAHEFEPDTRTYQPPPWLVQWLGDFSTDQQWFRDIKTPRPRSLRYQAEWVLCQMADRSSPYPETPADWRKVKTNQIDIPRVRQLLVENGLISGEGLLTQQALTILNELREKNHGKLAPTRDPERPSAHYGAFASTEAIIAVENPFLEHAKRIRKVRAIELEVASLFSAATEIGIPAFAVKGVSDYGNPDKDDAFHGYAAEASARWMYQFVRTYGHHLFSV